MQADHIGRSQDLFLRRRARARLADARLAPCALQPSTSCRLPRPRGGHTAPDGAQAEDAEGLPRAGEQLPRPVSLPHLGARRTILRATASIRLNACSATAKALMPGVLQTVTARMPAALRSMLSVPVPQTETSLSAGQAWKTAPLKRAWRADIDGRGGGADAPINSRSSVGAALGRGPGPPRASCALVRLGPGEAEGKSSGRRSRGAAGERAPGRPPLPHRPTSCGRDRGASARAPTASAARRAGSR